MEISITLNNQLVYDREFTKRDYIKLTGTGLLIALTLLTYRPTVSVFAVDKVKCLMNEATAWTILRLSEVVNHKELAGTLFSDMARDTFELTKYLIELGIEGFKQNSETTLLLTQLFKRF